MTGQYVFSLIVYEYRNNIQIGQITRDIQINIIDCPINFPPDVAPTTGDSLRGDTLFFSRNEVNCFNFDIKDINGLGVPEDQIRVNFKGPLADPSKGVKIDLTALSISNVLANICWKPSCDFIAGANDYIVFEVIDQNTCPGPNIVLDTFYFKLLPTSLNAPEPSCIIRRDVSSLQINWDPIPISGQLGFEAYYIYRDEGMGWEEIARINSPLQDSFIDISAPDDPGKTYCYRMALARSCPEFMLGEPGSSICSESSEIWEICQLGVINGQLDISWNPVSITGFMAYNVYRKMPDESDFSRIAMISNQMISSWTDSAATAEDGRVCYRLGMLNVCGTELLTEEHCTISLELIESAFNLRLEWEPYQGWNNGVEAYEVWKIPETGNPELLISLDGLSHFYNDREIQNDEGFYCYQIKAIATRGTSCADESFSWQMCFTFLPRIFLPNAFTPNGDGINDRFLIQGAFLRRYEMIIFDRWGRRVFQSQSLSDGWDGTVGGRLAAEGVYSYKISGEGFDGKKFERGGSITLIR